MREDVRWTNLSRRHISRQLKKRETPAGKNVVSQLLWEHGYCRRKPQKKNKGKSPEGAYFIDSNNCFAALR